MTELLKKMSPKTIMERKIEVPEETTTLYTIFGIASGVKSGESTYGSWSALVGQFEAVRIEDGKVFQGAQCFLPEPVHGMIVQQLRSGIESLDFAVEVTIKPEVNSATGYEYFGRLISDARENDPLMALRKRALSVLPAPATEAPEAETAPEEKPETPAQKKKRLAAEKAAEK